MKAKIKQYCIWKEEKKHNKGHTESTESSRSNVGFMSICKQASIVHGLHINSHIHLSHWVRVIHSTFQEAVIS